MLDLLVVVTTLALLGSCHHATEIDPSPTVPAALALERHY